MRIRTFAIIFLITGFLLVITSCHKSKEEQLTPPVITEDVVFEVDKPVNEFMQKYQVPGLSLAITRSGKLVYAKSYGMANKEIAEPAYNGNLFRIASVSKTITSIAILKLIENQQLSLDQKIFGQGALLGTSYGNRPYGSWITKITLHQLLQHTAGGWGNATADPMFSFPSYTLDELISNVLDNRPLNYEPGTQYIYSNFGYCLLEKVIEKVTGQGYEQWVKKNILEPCGISAMQIAGNALSEKKPGEVIYYGVGFDAPYNFNARRLGGAGGWLASATDLARLLVHADNFPSKPDILSTQSIDLMTMPSQSNPHYACGWAVNEFNNWWHLGSLPGTASIIVRAANGFCWAILCNTRSATPSFSAELDALIWKAVNNSNTQWLNVDLF